VPRKKQKSMRCSCCGSTFGVDARRKVPPPPFRREEVPFSTHVVLWCHHCHQPNGWSTRGRTNQLPALKAYALYLAKEFAKDAETFAGMCECVTCGLTLARDAGSRLHAGHCVPGLHLAGGWYFDRRCIHAQCFHCNGPESGRQREYEIWMRENHGDNLFFRIIDDKASGNKPVTAGLLREIIATYERGEPWMMPDVCV